MDDKKGSPTSGLSDKISFADLAAESQSQNNLQFSGFYNPKQEIDKEQKSDHQSLKGEAEDNFDFPLQLDFLNSQENHFNLPNRTP